MRVDCESYAAAADGIAPRVPLGAVCHYAVDVTGWASPLAADADQVSCGLYGQDSVGSVLVVHSCDGVDFDVALIPRAARQRFVHAPPVVLPYSAAAPVVGAGTDFSRKRRRFLSFIPSIFL